MATKGFVDPEVKYTYARARTLCQPVDTTPDLFPAVRGLWEFANGMAQHQVARELGEQLLAILLAIAQPSHDPGYLLEAHHALWTTLLHCGEFVAAYTHIEHGLALSICSRKPSLSRTKLESNAGMPNYTGLKESYSCDRPQIIDRLEG